MDLVRLHYKKHDRPQLLICFPCDSEGELKLTQLLKSTALREQLLHHVNDPTSQQRSLDPSVHSPGAANHAHNIDPAIAGPGMMSHSPGESGGEEAGGPESKRGGKRELSTSKRAAQNRAAQVCQVPISFLE